MKEYTIDATDRPLGRVASEAATLLMGKNTPEFRRNIAPQVSVKVLNASRLALSEKKKKEKTYVSWSGYPGGQKTATLEKVIDKKGYTDALTRAVRGMLPANKLRAVMLKNLTIDE
jgi:large subunit ribosomal protein L13